MDIGSEQRQEDIWKAFRITDGYVPALYSIGTRQTFNKSYPTVSYTLHTPRWIITLIFKRFFILLEVIVYVFDASEYTRQT